MIITITLVHVIMCKYQNFGICGISGQIWKRHDLIFMRYMFYINQLCTPSFSNVLVKTESDFIVRLVETGLWRWVLVVAVISFDSYPFLASSDLTCHLLNTGQAIIQNKSVCSSRALPFVKFDKKVPFLLKAVLFHSISVLF